MRAVILPLLFSAAVPLFAACGETASAPDPISAGSAFETNYAVVAAESHLRFTTTQEGEAFTGEFSDFDADIAFDPAAPETSRVVVRVPLASFEGGSTDRDSTAPSAVWLDARNFPVAMFETDAIRADGGQFVADGTLTLKGRSLPLSFPFTLEETGDRAVMTATVPLDRTRWNIGADPWNTDEHVGREVRLDIRVVADRSKQE
ncbi:YceI family protein [uncultured Algimonas sp.]|uniref:YceI family protein n=1 Tax=uncultured Algimonas sp. TaxID=1547920 RepID=UPI00260F2914|nr:YceI family protein [uncultured Algimonas sp.]